MNTVNTPEVRDPQQEWVGHMTAATLLVGIPLSLVATAFVVGTSLGAGGAAAQIARGVLNSFTHPSFEAKTAADVGGIVLGSLGTAAAEILLMKKFFGGRVDPKNVTNISHLSL